MIPSKWSIVDKDAEIELTMDKRRAHRLAGAYDNGARGRADVPADKSTSPLFYFEITVIKKCGPRGIGVGVSSKVKYLQCTEYKIDNL